MLMRTFVLLFLGVLAHSASADEQDAEVIFYSNGSPYTLAAPYADHATFLGTLFDGSKPIGFLQPKRFLALHVSPGEHVFSGGMSRNKPPKTPKLSLVLTPGGHYFVRAQMKVRGLIISMGEDRLDSVTCQIAHEEAEKLIPTDPKHIQMEMRSKIDAISSLPSCD